MTKLKKSDFQINNVSKSNKLKAVVYTSLLATSLMMGSCVSDGTTCSDSNSFDLGGSGSSCVDSD
jgi:hypothetical protein